MQLVETHLVRKTNRYFLEIDNICLNSKHLYNSANYIIRQKFFENNKDFKSVYSYESLYHIAKKLDEYRLFPTRISQQTLKLLCINWVSWIRATIQYYKNPKKFLGKPKIPKYLKENGRFVATYPKGAISFVNKDYIKLSRTNIHIPTKIEHKRIKQVRLVPCGNNYNIEVVYNAEINKNKLDYNLVSGIDIGLNNLATVTSNKAKYEPFFINGKPLKSLNQFYNKQKAYYQSKLPKNLYSSKRLSFIYDKRRRRINNYLHRVSRFIINNLIENNIGNLVIGKNDNWKQHINIGRKNNQHFASIPHTKFINMLKYKAKREGIIIYITEESYTSKCSFLDLEPIRKHKKYLGKRIKRGLFKSSDGRLINADVNGSLNIIRKVFPKKFNGIEDVVVHPIKFNL